MKKIIACLVFSLVGIAGEAFPQSTQAATVAPQTHRPCGAFRDQTPNPDRIQMLCGHGWGYFRVFGTCYRPVWVIENGVVVRKYREYVNVHSVTHLKLNSESFDIVFAHCPSDHPFVAMGKAFRPYRQYWHYSASGFTTTLPACHIHRHNGDTYVWKRYGRFCQFDVHRHDILNEFAYPRWWSNWRVKRRCNHIGGDFSPVSHHGRYCYDIDK